LPINNHGKHQIRDQPRASLRGTILLRAHITTRVKTVANRKCKYLRFFNMVIFKAVYRRIKGELEFNVNGLIK
jgi:hypothetical protein